MTFCLLCYLWFVPVEANGSAGTLVQFQILLKKVEFDVESIILKNLGERMTYVVQHLTAYSRQGIINIINNICWKIK